MTTNDAVRPVAWDYCPECGCEKTDGGFRDSKFCADCRQEWFPDMDYTSVVRIHLSNRKSSASAIAHLQARVEALTGEVERLRGALEIALSAIDETTSEMTVGDRFTNAGQSLIDALVPCRAALTQPEADHGTVTEKGVK